ncbi:MAG: general secretion pathway protein GspB [Gammaproteobacteria bacterium]|nr:general secretion pathway protein GspB [Gammaproteobacteria bacterium]
MSYILDALKKSEQDRGNGSIPNIQTIHSSALNYHQDKRPLWPWILIIALIINVFILIYFLKPITNTETITTDFNSKTRNNIEERKKNSVTENHPAQSSAPIAEPVITEPTPDTAVSEIYHNSVTAEETMKTSPLKPVVDIDDLPENIRQHIPSMVFSAHVYSSEPLQRSIVINNRFMEEGDAISYDLILAEITRNGAIFNFRGYRFSISVLSGWNAQ